MLLAIQLAATSGHVAACLGAGRAYACVGSLPYQRLVNNGLIHRHGKDAFIQVKLPYYRPLSIIH
jgi:hypothetical protein